MEKGKVEWTANQPHCLFDGYCSVSIIYLYQLLWIRTFLLLNLNLPIKFERFNSQHNFFNEIIIYSQLIQFNVKY